jgi:uncharacterized damage-inducible protein DinB
MADRLVRHFRAMARNNAWASDRLLEACEALAAAEFAAPRTASSRRCAGPNHIYGFDVSYLDAREQTGRGLAAVDPDPTVAVRGFAPPPE